MALEISRVEGEAPARGIEIHSDEEPVPLMAAAMLLHQSTQVSRRIPLVSSNQIPGSAGGFPWRVNSETDTLVHIKNITSEDQDYRIELRDNQGSVFSLGRKSIPAHGSLSLDLAAILAQVPIDENGSGLPASSSSGQVLWSSLGTDSKALIARAEEVEQRSGRSTSYSCFNCCPDSFFRASITSPSDGSEQLQLTARQQDANCYGTVMSPYQVFNASWSVADPSVATIDSNGNVFEGSDAGETDAFAAWVAVAFDFGGETGGTECAMTTPFALALGRIGSALTNFEFKDKVDSTADRLCRWEESCTMGKNPPTCFDDPLIVARIPLHRQCAAYLARAGLTFRDEDTGQVKCFPIGLVTEFNMPTPCT